jgi:hypothetical protein
MDMLGYVSVVEARNSRIQYNAENKGEIENGKIKTIIYIPDCILHGAVDPKNIERLY